MPPGSHGLLAPMTHTTFLGSLSSPPHPRESSTDLAQPWAGARSYPTSHPPLHHLAESLAHKSVKYLLHYTSVRPPPTYSSLVYKWTNTNGVIVQTGLRAASVLPKKGMNHQGEVTEPASRGGARHRHREAARALFPSNSSSTVTLKSS